MCMLWQKAVAHAIAKIKMDLLKQNYCYCSSDKVFVGRCCRNDGASGGDVAKHILIYTVMCGMVRYR
jgi:hypothetical protein